MPEQLRYKRRLRTLRIIAVVFVVLVSLGSLRIALFAAQRKPATGKRVSMMHEGHQRYYRIHVPEANDGSQRVPLVFCFHGGGGTAEVASRMGFSPVADEQNFIVVYPEGLNKHWNDGRKAKKFLEQDSNVDDVAFIRALLKKLSAQFRIDSDRVFATGASNGGFFSHRLAIEASDKFSAAAIMIATLPKPFEEQFKPKRPISVLFMNGTDDPFVPYAGGRVTPNLAPRWVNSKTRDFGRGECTSTDVAVDLWLKTNGLETKEPSVARLPDSDPDDGCRVERSVWSSGKRGSEVVLYRIEGGGHTIPGGVQYLSERIIGKTCQDIDAIQTIWRFFERTSQEGKDKNRE